jgi:hypothetical protein
MTRGMHTLAQVEATITAAERWALAAPLHTWPKATGMSPAESSIWAQAIRKGLGFVPETSEQAAAFATAQAIQHARRKP